MWGMFCQKKTAHQSIRRKWAAPCGLIENLLSEKMGDSLFTPKFPGSEFLAQRFGGKELHELSTANINWLLSIAANPICSEMTHPTRKVRTTIHRLFRKRQFINNPKIAQTQEKSPPDEEKKRTESHKIQKRRALPYRLSQRISTAFLSFKADSMP